ncbi:MAG: hybrid sensor histidine kinase/response regulator [Cyanobacteria bacterium J007]|nr:MAG: hybrid sensor histidine kinase/response regulator [Cyanobacteria bacterium J007]
MENKSSETDYKATILVVDDTPDNLRVVSAILVDRGYQVGKALNGQLALMACKHLSPDLILLDINMPEMNGYEVCKKLKTNPQTQEIPIIFISALDDVLDKVKAFEVGGVDYITKPFQSAEVISRVDSHLKLRSLQIALQAQNDSLEREIEQRQKIQEALELSEAQNLALLNAIPDLMLRISADGIFLDYRMAKNSDDANQNSVRANLLTSFAASTSSPGGDRLSPSYTNPQSNPHLKLHASLFPEVDRPEQHNPYIGQKLTDILSEDLAFWMMHYTQQTLMTSQMQVGEFVQQIDRRWHGYEARFVKSGPSEVLAIVRDISERNQAEAERLKTEAILRAQKQQLEKTLSDLKQAQAQLIQSEKMASLGQLVAGIAHEINNPINFIYGNVSYLKQYAIELLKALEFYQHEFKGGDRDDGDDLDLDFLKSDTQKILNSMQNGADRIRKIVTSLRNFARLDEAEMKCVDLHEGIESSLVLVRHRLQREAGDRQIQVIKEYGDLPKVMCYPSQLNEVFFNLLNNAIDTIEEKLKTTTGSSEAEDDDRGWIRIRTETTAEGTVTIRIADSGLGIPESARSRLFDPFFTTKSPGSGTGLGLSVSYQIVVQKHHGQILCDSTPGRGTEFILKIPINPSEKE